MANRISSYEATVIKLLTAAAIPFQREKQFKDLRNGYYRFDFYIPSLNIVIEVDGQQHFSYNKYFHKKREDYLEARERDRQKNSYCLAHHIKLYRIPYWEFDFLASVKDLFNPKFLVKTKYHNDIIHIPKT